MNHMELDQNSFPERLMTPEERERYKTAYEAAFPLFTCELGGAPRRATPKEIARHKARSISGMKADFVIMDDPMKPDPVDEANKREFMEELFRSALPKVTASEAETERAAQEALIYGSSVRRVESDGAINRVDMETLSNEQLDEFIRALVGSRAPAEDAKAARDARKREMLKAAYSGGRVLFDPSREPVGGESLWDMTQRKLFEREASAEPVYLSQFPDTVFNPTAGAWSGAGRIIDTSY